MEKELKELLQETDVEYRKSTIAKSNPEWTYSISATQIEKDKILLVGFNWGAEIDENGNNVKYNSQKIEDINRLSTENKNFKSIYNKLASFKKVYNQLSLYLPNEDIDNCIQSNFCFFRSRKEDQISHSDLQLSTPLFETFLKIADPQKIIGFSSKLRDYFLENKLAELKFQEIKSNKRTIVVAKGTYKNKPIYFLPHPNAKITGNARKEAWGFCFETPKNK